jgi:DNA-binding XRE family transcriptional regulator
VNRVARRPGLGRNERIMQGKGEGRKGNERSSEWWAALAGKLLHPLQVGIVKAFDHVGLPLCVRDLAEILAGVEPINLDHHVGRLRMLGALGVAGLPQSGRGSWMCSTNSRRREMISVAGDRSSVTRHLGATIRAHRMRRSISQEKIGRRISLDRTEISLLERGEREPRLGTVVKLASALEVPLGSLLRGIEWKVPAKEFVFEIRDHGRGE